ncbi:MAG: META domain-containing protein [Phycisphaerales bacterium]|nr:META domain-containing protein [Phycisphaerales bacterium]
MSRILLALLGVAFVAVMGCSSLDDIDWGDSGSGGSGYGGNDYRDDHDDGRDASAAVDRDDVVGVEWTANWMWGAEIVEKSAPTLLLGSDDRATGFAGVNRYSGGYTLNTQKGRLKFDALAMTRMAGPAANSAQEQAFADRLSRVSKVRINRHGELELLEKNDVIVRLERSADAIRYGLVGTDWELIRLRGDKLAKGHEASISFRDDGSFAGFAGVNRVSGRYTIDNRNGRIELREFVMTEMAGDERIMRQEERLVASLRAVDHFSFSKDGDLLLHNGNNVAARYRKQRN